MQPPAEIVSALGYKLLSSEPLAGGVSATTHALTVEPPTGELEKWVLRQKEPTWDSLEYAVHTRLLEMLAEAGVPAPRPVYYTADYLITAYIEGTTDPPAGLDLALKQMAKALHLLHSTPIQKGWHPWFAQLNNMISDFEHRKSAPNERYSESILREVAESYFFCENSRYMHLCHGDFWPGNVVWHNDRIVAIIDWEDCCLGDPLYDVGNARLEILWKWGQRAMERFTDFYAELVPFRHGRLAFWDLMAATRPIGKIESWGLPDKTVQEMLELHRWFVAQALETRRVSTP